MKSHSEKQKEIKALFQQLSSLARGFKEPHKRMSLAKQVQEVLEQYSGKDLLNDLQVDRDVYVLHRFVTALDACSLDLIFKKLACDKDVDLFARLDLYSIQNKENKTLLDCLLATTCGKKEETLKETLNVLKKYSHPGDANHNIKYSEMYESFCDLQVEFKELAPKSVSCGDIFISTPKIYPASPLSLRSDCPNIFLPLSGGIRNYGEIPTPAFFGSEPESPPYGEGGFKAIESPYKKPKI